MPEFDREFDNQYFNFLRNSDAVALDLVMILF